MALPDTQRPSALETEIPRQPAALHAAAAVFPDSVQALLAAVADRGVDDWVVTGCGDSLFAALCAEVWFARLAGLRLRAVHAMTLSRHTYPGLTARSVLLAVSHSGTTARVLEAARAAKSRGAYVVAVTANSDSELARGADLWVDNAVQQEHSNTRTASFQAVALFMLMLADAVGTGRLPRQVIDPATVAALVAPARAQVAALPAPVVQAQHWIFVGSGLGYAVAHYGKAKAYEAATLPAHVAELEEMIHCEIFSVTAATVVVLIAPAGPSLSRAGELLGGLAQLGAVTIAVTDDPSLAAAATHALHLPGNVGQDLLPFHAVLPLQWLALRMAQVRGQDPDRVANKWVNRPLIDDSQQWQDTDYAPHGCLAPAGHRR